MTALQKQVPSTPDIKFGPHESSETEEQPSNAFYCPSDAECIFSAAQILFKNLLSGKPITAAHMRKAMEDAFGATDADGDWVWKDAYEASEVAQLLMLDRYGQSMLSSAANPHKFLLMIIKLSALVPTQTIRSDEMLDFQQFSTPLPLAAIAAHGAGITSIDHVLEPSAGTGHLAMFAKLHGAFLSLNELAEKRRELLALTYGNPNVSAHDASNIDDRLDCTISPNIILMNPPFSVAPNVKGRFKGATGQHILSALARLQQDGRLVAITGESFNPSVKTYQSSFKAIEDIGRVVFSAPIAGKLFRSHGTMFDTRLTVIDKTETGSHQSSDVFHNIAESFDDLLNLVIEHCPSRKTEASSLTNKISPKSIVANLRQTARAQSLQEAELKSKHPFDLEEPHCLIYQESIEDGSDNDIDNPNSNNVYEPYQVQAISIQNAAEHPTALVQSAAMASVVPPYLPLVSTEDIKIDVRRWDIIWPAIGKPRLCR